MCLYIVSLRGPPSKYHKSGGNERERESVENERDREKNDTDVMRKYCHKRAPGKVHESPARADCLIFRHTFGGAVMLGNDRAFAAFGSRCIA